MSSFHLHDIQRKTGKFIRKFGTHDDVDSSVSINEAIWSYANVAGDYEFLSNSGETLYISSGNDLDTQEIVVQGLDENFEEKSVLVVLTGTSRIAIPGLWTRVNRAYNNGNSDTSGTVYIYKGGANTLGIPDTASEVKAVIENGHNQTMQAIYSVPAGQELNLSSFHLSADPKTSNSTIDLTIVLCVREHGKVFRTQEIVAVNNSSPTVVHYDMPIQIPEKSDVLFKILSCTANNAHVHCAFEGMLL